MSASLFVAAAAVTLLGYWFGLLEGLPLHLSGEPDQVSDAVRCLGGPGVLPGWVGTMLSFPATAIPTMEGTRLGDVLGVPDWLDELGLSSAARETLTVLLEEWDGPTIGEAVETARRLTEN